MAALAGGLSGGGLALSLPTSPDGCNTVGVEMNRKRSRGLVVGSIFAAGVAGITLSVFSLTGFASAVGGDSMAAPMSGLSLATLLVGGLALLSLELTHVSSRGSRRVTVVRTAGEPARGPSRGAAGSSTRASGECVGGRPADR